MGLGRHTGHSLSRTQLAMALAIVVMAALAAGCSGPPTERAVGVVLSVESSSAAEVSRFTLRTAEGETLDFEVGALQTGGETFPAAHLREHQLNAEPVAVTYRVDDERRIAVRLEDEGH
ncbi:hypothetical protein BH20CHL6_BH20CHL6_12480 [soil metagenome]